MAEVSATTTDDNAHHHLIQIESHLEATPPDAMRTPFLSAVKQALKRQTAEVRRQT